MEKRPKNSEAADSNERPQFPIDVPGPVRPPSRSSYSVTLSGKGAARWSPKTPPDWVLAAFSAAIDEAKLAEETRQYTLLVANSTSESFWDLKRQILRLLAAETRPLGGRLTLDLTMPPWMEEPAVILAIDWDRVEERRALEELNSLARPAAPPPEIVKLAEILESAKAKEPLNKAAFVTAVNAALETWSFCIRIDATGKICRKLYLDRNGVIGLQKTDGKKIGFKNQSFTLIPYVRPYDKK